VVGSFGVRRVVAEFEVDEGCAHRGKEDLVDPPLIVVGWCRLA